MRRSRESSEKAERVVQESNESEREPVDVVQEKLEEPIAS